MIGPLIVCVCGSHTWTEPFANRLTLGHDESAESPAALYFQNSARIQLEKKKKWQDFHPLCCSRRAADQRGPEPSDRRFLHRSPTFGNSNPTSPSCHLSIDSYLHINCLIVLPHWNLQCEFVIYHSMRCPFEKAVCFSFLGLVLWKVWSFGLAREVFVSFLLRDDM